MENGSFSLSETMTQAWHAASSVVCRIGFEAALHGLVAAAFVFVIAICLQSRGHRYGQPLLAVFKKLAIFCLVLSIPGFLALASSGRLPAVNALELSSIGLLGFWSLVILHLCMEEMNFQWFSGNSDDDDEEASGLQPDAPSEEPPAAVSWADKH